MTAYVVLLGVVFFSSIISCSFLEQKKRNIFILGSGFFIVLLLLCLRDVSVGTDVKNYINIYFIADGQKTWGEIFSESGVEILFHLLCKCIYIIWDSERFFLICMAFLTLIPVAVTYIRNVKNMPVMVFLLFMGMDCFVMMFSGIRQAIAVGFMFAGYRLFINRNTFKYICLTIFCCLFHVSAVIGLLFYCAYNIKVSKLFFAFMIIPLILIVFIFRYQILDLGIKILSYLNPRYGIYTAETNTGGGLSFLIFFITTVVMFIFDSDDEVYIRMRSVMILASVIQIFTTVHSLAARITLYIVPMFPLIVEMILNNRRVVALGYRTPGRICYYILAILEVTMFLYSGGLNTIPYLFFW